MLQKDQGTAVTRLFQRPGPRSGWNVSETSPNNPGVNTASNKIVLLHLTFRARYDRVPAPSTTPPNRRCILGRPYHVTLHSGPPCATPLGRTHRVHSTAFIVSSGCMVVSIKSNFSPRFDVPKRVNVLPTTVLKGPYVPGGLDLPATNRSNLPGRNPSPHSSRPCEGIERESVCRYTGWPSSGVRPRSGFGFAAQDSNIYRRNS